MFIKNLIKKYNKILSKKRFIENPLKEIEIIICNVLNISLSRYLLIKDNYYFKHNEIKKINKIIKKRLKGYSIASIIKKIDFFGYNFYVNKNVLIPRPETEILLELFFKKIDKNKNYNILEIGTGSGVISIIIALNLNNVKIDSLELSKKAIMVAKKNIKNYSINSINLIHKNFFKYKPEKKYDIIISNPPYIPKIVTKNLLKNKFISDPFLSLNGGNDGLKFYKKIKKFADEYLINNGLIFLEHGINQREQIKKIYSDYHSEFYDDLAGIDRIIIAKKIKEP